MSAALVLDVLVAVLLVATITYAVILNRKLGRLRADRSEFEKMLKKFVDATSRAEQGVAHLQRVADASASQLDAKRSSSVALRDDLEFLASRAEEQADRLEALIARGRSQEGPRSDVDVSELLRDVAPEPRTSPDDTGPTYLFESADGGDDAPADEPADDAAFDNTPAWLTSARRLAGAGEELR